MRKKTTRKKFTNDEADADTVEEVINGKTRHEVSDNDVEFRATLTGKVVAEGNVDVNKGKKHKKKKKKDEIRGGDVDLSANENAIVMKDETKRKNKQNNEDGGNDSGLSARWILCVVENNAGEVKRKEKEEKRLQEVSGNGTESSVNQSESVIDSDVHVDKKKKKRKKKKSKKRQEVGCDDDEFGAWQNETIVEGDVDMDNTENEKDRRKKKRKLEINEDENVTTKAKKKKDRINNEGEASGVNEGSKQKHLGLEENTSLQKNDLEVEGKKDKKKKAKTVEKRSGGVKKASRTKKGVELPNDPSEKSAQKERYKRVSFSNHMQVFPSSDSENDKDDGFVHGKRFSLEEDEIIKKAVINYIEAHRLGPEGLDMVLHCRSHPQVKNCWKEIGVALPWRPYESIYYRAHIIFERYENRKWTPEELELIQKFHEKHGSDWKMLAGKLGKHRLHVKDAWRRIKLPNRKRGQWSHEEYQKLFDLVNMDLRLKAFEEKKTKHGMLRDNISWEAISDKLSTRSNSICCMKWYDQLTSPMVAEGKWADTDDFHLLNALSSLDACCTDDIDWENLLKHRSGTICRKRWSQMVKHLGAYGNKSFPEQVEILSTRYCPDVLEAREAYNGNETTV